MKTYEQYINLTKEKLQKGDIINPKGVDVSLDTIYTYYRYNKFYAINRKFFIDVIDIKSLDNFNKFLLEEFYEKYRELTINAFETIYKYSTVESVWGAQIMNIRDEWLKRIPELNIYVQTDKYNL